MVMMIMRKIIKMMTIIVMLMLSHAWRPPRGFERVQRDSAPKLIAIHFVEIQNWGRC